MYVKKLELLKEVSIRNRDYVGEEPEPLDVSIRGRVIPVNGRLWPNEVDVVIRGRGADSRETVFSYQASYAVAFNEKVIEGTQEPAEVVWPLIRAGTVSQLRKIGVELNSKLPYKLNLNKGNVG